MAQKASRDTQKKEQMRSWGNVLRGRIFLRGSAASGGGAGFGLQRTPYFGALSAEAK